MDNIQIRDKMGERLTKIYSDSLEMGKQGVFDRKVLGVQLVTSESKVSDTKKALSVWVRLASSDYSLSDRQEVVLSRSLSLEQAAEVLQEKVGCTDLQMARVFNVCAFDRHGLAEEEWLSLKGD